jgi:hypothetical protein
MWLKDLYVYIRKGRGELVGSPEMDLIVRAAGHSRLLPGAERVLLVLQQVPHTQHSKKNEKCR